MLVSILEYLVSDRQMNTQPYVRICSKVYDNYRLVETPIKVLLQGVGASSATPWLILFSIVFYMCIVTAQQQQQPKNKITKTVLGLRLSNRWEYPPTTHPHKLKTTR